MIRNGKLTLQLYAKTACDCFLGPGIVGVLPKQDRQEYSQDQSEKPQRRRRCSYLTDPAQFASRKFRIKDKPAGVSALEQKKGQGSHSAINQVAHEGR